MKIRTQLVAAFLLLAVVPLTSIVLYSFVSSKRAVEHAVETEANQLTQEMEQRMAGIKAKLGRGVERLGRLDMWRDLEHVPAPGDALVGRLIEEMGEAAPLVRSLIFVPRVPPAPEGDSGGVVVEPDRAPMAPAAPAPPAHPTDPEMPSLRIDVSGLLESYRDEVRRQAAETPAEGEIAAELGRETAEIVALSLSQAFEMLRSGDDEERQAEILERHAETLERSRRPHDQAIWELRAGEHQLSEERRRRAERLLGQELGTEIRDQGRLVGEIHAEIVETEELVRQVLVSTPRNHGEIPFAFDGDDKLYVADEEDRPLLESLRLDRDPVGETIRPRRSRGEWMIVSTLDPDTGMTFGVAHPIGDSLAEIERTAGVNFTLGLAFIVFALLGILPLSKRITRGLEAVSEGAARIAQGDLTARVPVESKNEIGQLAAAFNGMAEDLRAHQERLVEEEGKRKEQELEKRFLEVEFQRKSRELEDARQFQLSLLPKKLPKHPAFEVAVDMQTATEVGGDYYDFHLTDDGDGGVLTLAIGDATGHGARAGTMVTVIKSLFSTLVEDLPLDGFLRQAGQTVKRMDLGRMAMALTVARLEEKQLTLSAAGMPPALLHRASTGAVEELALAGMPLGSLASAYEERRVELRPGDTLLFLSDGLPELPNAGGEPLGYAEVRRLFAAAAGESPARVIEAMHEAAERWTGGQPPGDDMTFVVVRRRLTAGSSDLRVPARS